MIVKTSTTSTDYGINQKEKILLDLFKFNKEIQKIGFCEFFINFSDSRKKKERLISYLNLNPMA